MQLEPVQRQLRLETEPHGSRSPRDACAVSMLDSIIRRIRPQISASQDPSKGICATAKALGLKPVLAADEFAELCVPVTVGPTVSVGKSPERAIFTAALAPR